MREALAGGGDGGMLGAGADLRLIPSIVDFPGFVFIGDRSGDSRAKPIPAESRLCISKIVTK